MVKRICARLWWMHLLCGVGTVRWCSVQVRVSPCAKARRKDEYHSAEPAEPPQSICSIVPRAVYVVCFELHHNLLVENIHLSCAVGSVIWFWVSEWWLVNRSNVGLSVCPSMQCQYLKNSNALRPLGRGWRTWRVYCIFYESRDNTSRKQNFEVQPLRHVGPLRT